MTLDDFLADSALRPTPAPAAIPRRVRARFIPGSGFIARMGLPPLTEGLIVGRWDQDGDEKLAMLIEGVPGIGYASGVPAEEVETLCPTCGRAGDGAPCGIGGCPLGLDL